MMQSSVFFRLHKKPCNAMEKLVHGFRRIYQAMDVFEIFDRKTITSIKSYSVVRQCRHWKPALKSQAVCKPRERH